MSEEHQTEPATEDRRPLTNGTGAPEPDDGPDETDASEPMWREDWRDRFAGGDEKRAKELLRFSSPETFAKAGFEARERLRSTRAAPSDPPDDATEAEVNAWRKQAGIPETPDGYGVSFGENASEQQKAELADFLKYAHEKHLAPRAVKEAVTWFQSAQAAASERAAEQAEEATIQGLSELRAEFPGREWKKMFGSATKRGEKPTGLANDFLGDHFDTPEAQDALDDILNAKLPNGVALGSSPHFMRFIASMARKFASEDDLVAGDVGGGARSVDEEFKELAAKPKLTDTERSRMTQLAEARIKRDERAAAR